MHCALPGIPCNSGLTHLDHRSIDILASQGLPRKQFAQLQHKMLSNLADAKGVAAGLSKSAQQTMLAAEELFLRARDDLLPDFHRQLGLLSIILKCLAAIAVLAFLDWLVYFIGRMTAASMYLLSLVALVPLDIPGAYDHKMLRCSRSAQLPVLQAGFTSMYTYICCSAQL